MKLLSTGTNDTFLSKDDNTFCVKRNMMNFVLDSLTSPELAQGFESFNDETYSLPHYLSRREQGTSYS
jgi:hypothetical protein